MKNKRSQFWVSTILAVIITAGAIYVLKGMLGKISMSDLETALGQIHPVRLLLALIVTVACYVSLSFYDWAALKTIGHKQSWMTALAGAVAAYSLSHNLGFAPITATGARWRVYAPFGIPFGDITRIVFLTGIAFWFGVLFLFGAVMAINPSLIGDNLPFKIADEWQHGVGLAIVLAFTAYVMANRMGLKQIGWKGISVPTPSMRLALAQGVVTIIEMTLASLVLWLLIPNAGISEIPLVFIAYIVAFTSVLITHAPGGVGVLEAITIAMLPQLGAANVLVGLLLFRIIFHIIPLVVGAIIMMRVPARAVVNYPETT